LSVTFLNTDSALDTLAKQFKAKGGVLTRAQMRDCLVRFPLAVRKAAISQLEIVAEVEWVKSHGGRPLPGDKFFWPKRRVQA
jgi:hypothetical protein